MVTLEDARTVAQSLAEKISPVSVILFGSVARTGKGSDLDILVVTEQEDMHREVSSCLRGHNRRFAIDYFVASVDRITRNFREGSPFLRLVQKEGRVLYMKNSMKEWIGLALEDFRQAKYLFKGSFYRGACFAAQQAVEKAIKAELLQRGWDLDDIDFMDSIYRGRYPAEEGLLPLNAPTAEDASRAISTAEGVLKQLQLLEKNEQEK